MKFDVISADFESVVSISCCQYGVYTASQGIMLDDDTDDEYLEPTGTH
jgi:hypothetical protein